MKRRKTWSEAAKPHGRPTCHDRPVGEGFTERWYLHQHPDGSSCLIYSVLTQKSRPLDEVMDCALAGRAAPRSIWRGTRSWMRSAAGQLDVAVKPRTGRPIVVGDLAANAAVSQPSPYPVRYFSRACILDFVAISGWIIRALALQESHLSSEFVIS